MISSILQRKINVPIDIYGIPDIISKITPFKGHDGGNDLDNLTEMRSESNYRSTAPDLRCEPQMISVTGHRGARNLIPENTLKGFAYARDIGCDRIELDIHLTKDKKLAVIHDDDLSRTTNGSGSVANFTFQELQAFDAGDGERIPSLEEVFELLKNADIRIQIELKGPETEKYAPDLVSKWKMEDRVIFTSFFHQRVKIVKECLPDVEAGILIGCNPVEPGNLLQSAGADALHVNYTRIDPQLVHTVHSLNKKIVAWGIIVEIPVIENLIDLGVDVIGSDRPDLVLQCLRNRGARSN